MKAIQIKVLPATNFKSARVKAWTEGGNTITVPYQYEISSFEAQAENVAQELIYRMRWNVTIKGIGGLPNGDYVAVIG